MNKQVKLNKPQGLPKNNSGSRESTLEKLHIPRMKNPPPPPPKPRK